MDTKRTFSVTCINMVSSRKPNPIGTGPTITVTPPLAGANYTCHLVYPTCNAGWSTCNVGIGNLGPDTVFVAPGPPNLPPPNLVLQDPHCNNVVMDL